MPAPYAASTELDAVNQILSSVGQAPVTTLDLQNPEVAIVLTTLREVNKQVQAEGWNFNIERGVKFPPDASTKEIKYPTDVLQLDTTTATHRDEYNPVRRNGKFYDKTKHTFKWDKTIEADVTKLFDFEDVPPAIQLYITARAARLASNKMVGDTTLYQLLQEQEIQTRAAALEYDCNQADHSIFGWREGENFYNNFQPFHALMR